jgi:dolichyl-phosphate-mannose-protein mannosyltransferase
MSTKANTMNVLDEPKKKRAPSRSPARKPNGNRKADQAPVKSFKSEGVGNYDIFSLPGSDWQLLTLVTIIGAAVRLYKITQPTSVVFDEVQ